MTVSLFLTEEMSVSGSLAWAQPSLTTGARTSSSESGS